MRGSEYFLKYLSLGIADPQKLDGCLEKLTAKLVLQGSTVNIFSFDGLHQGPLDLQEFQDLPVNKHKDCINLHCDTLC